MNLAVKLSSPHAKPYARRGQRVISSACTRRQ
jgi:hypothetical protein